LLWLGVSLAALLLVYARFRMAHFAPGRRWSFRRRRSDAPVAAGARPVAATPRIRGTFDRATRVRQLLAIALHSYRELITSRGALILPGIALLLFKITPELMEVALGTPGRPTTGRVVMLLASASTVGIFVGALIAFFAGQLVWRERDAREHDIADAAPVPDALTLAGKFGGLALLLVTLQALQMAAGIAAQMAAGYDHYQPSLYLGVLFGLKLADYLLFAALAMAVQVVVNQKYLGTAIAMLAWLYADYAGELGIEHNLLVYGSDPGVRYSDISGFGASLAPWLWFKLYWFGWALVFALLARLLWVRGHEGALERRLALARRRFTMAPRAIAAVATIVIALAGGFVFYNTNVLNDYLSDAVIARRSADYEKRYGRYATLAQPLVAATKLRIELHPSARRAEVRGTYRLENRSGRAIETIHLVTHRTVPTTAVAFDRAARATLIDEQLGYRIYTLGEPLAAGESLLMDFEVRFAPRGFTNRGISTAVTANGTFFEHRPDDSGRTWLPSVGYRRGVELDNAYDRRMHGLPARPAVPPATDVAARNDERSLERIDLETIIGTDADQIAIAPGALRRSWTEDRRRYFHYATDAPIRNGFPILSARYAVHRSKANGVDVEVVYHPGHAWNVERIARSARAALDYCSREFGAYPHRQLRLVEFPNTGGNRLTGHPGTVVWSESFAVAQPETDWRELDVPFAVVAHEVAHQWWGNKVTPARVEGAPLVSESLAWYSAMKVVEQTLGRKNFDGTMEVMRAAYLTPHETPEVPLLRAGDWLGGYRTGALAMHALREAIGTERVNKALRQLVDEFGSGRSAFATSLDLYRHLRAVTPADTQSLLKDLFEEITFWDLRMKSVSAAAIAGGAYRVTLEVEAYKVKVGNAGRETRVPMNDAIDVAVFGADRTPLYVQPHRIRAGVQTIVVTVRSRPASAGIDADSRLLDRKRDDNVRELGAK
ncbi:MAG TPA: M1 family aminopeptidase, partial [Thermoanaerobaculia bacterium]